MASAPVIVAAASRPYPGETTNGDAWQVDWQGERCRIAVIDGLGHGPAAALAASAAREALGRAPELLPDEGLRVCHRALANTRGAAISIASIDVVEHRLIYAGVGNVDGDLWQFGRREHLVAYRGIVGVVLPTLRSFSFPLPPEWLVVMHTDGVRAHFNLQGLSEARLADPQQLAEEILRTWARPTDDATVVVARGGRPPALGDGGPA
jgi:serine phosphatase RsbU (regulator of sigma subunit)